MKKSQVFFLAKFSILDRCFLRFFVSTLVLCSISFCPFKGEAEEVTVRALCYGPGLFGQRTASGQILTRETTGVAHRRIRLGSNIKLRYQGQELETKVIDRGPYCRGAELDLTEGLVKSWGFKSCRDFGIRKIVIVK